MAKKKAARQSIGPKIHEYNENRFIVCALTDEEVSEAAQTLAKYLDDHAALEDALKTVKADYKAKLEAATANIKVQQRLVRDKSETRLTDVLVRINYTDCTYTAVRKDTDEQIEDRKLRGDEKQLEIDFEGE